MLKLRTVLNSYRPHSPQWLLSIVVMTASPHCIVGLKVPYHKKHVFSALYIYKLVLPEPANSQKEENQ